MRLKIGEFGDLIWRNEKVERHRENGPAVIFTNGRIWFFFNDKFHRLDGPAAIYPYGFKRYFIHDKEYSKEEYYTEVKGYDPNDR